MDTVTSIPAKSITQSEWEKLASLGHEVEFQNWLELQCRLIDTTTMGLLAVRHSDESKFEPVAMWPANVQGAEPLVELIDQVIEAGNGLITRLHTNAPSALQHYGVAFPVIVDDIVMAVAALSVAPASESALRDVLHQLQWGSAWVELGLLRTRVAGQDEQLTRTSHALTLLSKVLGEEHFEASAMRLVSELALLTHADVVCIGFPKRTGMRLEYLSNSARFSKEMNLVRATEAAMDECADQLQRIIFPAPTDVTQTLVDHAHRDLCASQKDASLLTIPLFDEDQCVGVISLQRGDARPFSTHDADFCESVVALASAALEQRRDSERPLGKRMLKAAGDGARSLLGNSHWERKLALLAIIALGAFFYFAHGSYRLSADAVLESSTQRVIVAPFDGFINSAPVSAGDRIEAGQVLVGLDERDLRLEQLKWESQRSRLNSQYQEAIADNDRSGINIVSAQLEQARAQVELVESQLERATQSAPFEGLVVSGDLDQRLGGPVTKGEVLFEISPADAYRVSLKVAENRISDIAVGQRGSLYLSALPDTAFLIEIEKIRPNIETAEGASFFIVEARLDELSVQMQPGMEGIGKIYVDERRLITIWTRSVLDWLRLHLWSFWG